MPCNQRGMQGGIRGTVVLHHPFHGYMSSPGHFHDIRTWAGLGMDLERAGAFGSQMQCMSEDFVRSRQQFRAHFIMGPAAFQGNRFSFPHEGGSTVETGFHDGGCFCKRHPFGQSADLCGVNSQHGKDNETGFTDHLRDPEGFIKDLCIVRPARRVHGERPGRFGYEEEMRSPGPQKILCSLKSPAVHRVDVDMIVSNGIYRGSHNTPPPS